MRRFGYAALLTLLIAPCGCADILEVPDISKETVMLLAPADGVVLDNGSLTLSWEHVQDATGYHIQVATPDFENAAQLVLDSIVEMDTLGYVANHIDQNLANGTYTWRVNAFNSGFETQFSTSGFQIIDNDETEAVSTTALQSIKAVKGTKAGKTNKSGIHH